MSGIQSGRSDIPMPSRHIHRLIMDGQVWMDIIIKGRCGTNIWVEFPDDETAQDFRKDLFKFVREWEPGSGSPDDT